MRGGEWPLGNDGGSEGMEEGGEVDESTEEMHS